MSRRLFRRVRFLVLAISIVLGSSASISFVEANPGEIRFRPEAGTQQEYLNEIVEGVYLGKYYVLRSWGMLLPEPIDVDIRIGKGIPGSANARGISFSTGDPGWTETTARQRLHIAVHEFVHVAHSQIQGDARPFVWMTEGIAEFMSYDALIQKELADAGDVSGFHQLNVAVAPGMIPLQEMEDNLDFSTGAVYSLAYLAVEQLAIEHGLKSFRTYFEVLGEGLSNEQAFVEVFGIELASFYEEFTLYRLKNLNPPYNAPLSLMPPGPVQEIEAAVTMASAPTSAKRGDQTVLSVYTAPSVRCVLESAREGGTPYRPIPTQSDLAGIAQWLWTIDRALQPGTYQLSVTCGGEPVIADLIVV